MEYEDEYDHKDPMSEWDGLTESIEDTELKAAFRRVRQTVLRNILRDKQNICSNCHESILTIEDVGICRQCRLTSGVLAA